MIMCQAYTAVNFRSVCLADLVTPAPQVAVKTTAPEIWVVSRTSTADQVDVLASL